MGVIIAKLGLDNHSSGEGFAIVSTRSETQLEETHLSPSSLKLSMPNGCRLSARVFFLISLPVRRLPLFVSACDTTHTVICSIIISSSSLLPSSLLLRDLGQEASEVRSHARQHFLLLGVVVSLLLGFLFLFSLAFLLTDEDSRGDVRTRQPCLQVVDFCVLGRGFCYCVVMRSFVH